MDYASYKFLTVERKDNGVLFITMNRPEVLNATDEDGHAELGRIWLDFDRDQEAKVALITGAGKGFCAGGDMRRDVPVNAETVSLTMENALAIVRAMVELRKPVVSAINGAAVGAGLAVALLADISIASERAKLIDGHTKLGVVAGDHAALIWPLLCGMARAKYYLLLCEPVSGREAAEMGLVSKCVEHDQLLPTAMSVANRLASGSQWAIRGTKHVLNGWLRQNTASFDYSWALEMASFFMPDNQEGLRAFREKRSPNFTGGGGPFGA
ncbi:MAG: enoyl-CoA hydratase/isomerase family protein [Acidisphaera sp.]|nr:enoyl-CoA hydratase/isomerase family protein [Acidisphaera sp.]